MLHTRPTAVAGRFYPADPRVLFENAHALLAGARPAAPGDAVPKALIVPHAGYVYSGPIAASAYARLAPARGVIRRVVLLGPSHRCRLRGLALPDADAFASPLGPVRVDARAADALRGVARSAEAHAAEHSLEVQLPFLEAVLGKFTLVPLVVGDAGPAEVADAIEALWGGPETVIVVSSDLSHYLPYALARSVDTDTARRILELAPVEHDQACGAAPVNGLLLAAARRRLHPVVLDLRSSGDTAGGRDEVVGYGAFAFEEVAT